jgi:hypothetical protein
MKLRSPVIKQSEQGSHFVQRQLGGDVAARAPVVLVLDQRYRGGILGGRRQAPQKAGRIRDPPRGTLGWRAPRMPIWLPMVLWKLSGLPRHGHSAEFKTASRRRLWQRHTVASVVGVELAPPGAAGRVVEGEATAAGSGRGKNPAVLSCVLVLVPEKEYMVGTKSSDSVGDIESNYTSCRGFRCLNTGSMFSVRPP